jgi:hypothetical protein
MKEWQKIKNVSREMISMWARTWPDAHNTGALCHNMPALDLDIMCEDAAITCEEFTREAYEERGWFLVRVGRAPKRAVIFRVDSPFRKITVPLIAPNGSSDEKVELLAAGQQIVVDGLHPIGVPYRWFGGEPWRIRRDELPYLHEHEAQRLVDDVVRILTGDFGYQRARSPTSRGGAVVNGARPANGEDAWQQHIGNILAGNTLHDSIRDLAGMLVASGMSSGAATHLLAALVELSEVPHDARWDARYRDVSRAIDSAMLKFR